MCGIVAFLPKGKGRPNRRMLLAMGMANEERGTDNCGISVGDTIMRGGYSESKFRDFYIKNKVKVDEALDCSKPVIIHTRKSTSNSTGDTYAHPFIFFTKSENGEMAKKIVGCHNGIITNKEELFTKFCTPESNRKLVTIDSQYILLSLLLADDKKEVLQVYEGNAALIFYTHEGFYVWKGACNQAEERPMFYMETVEGWYFASTKENFLFNSDYNIEPTMVKHNELLKFTLHGKLVSSTIVPRTKVTAPVNQACSVNNYHDSVTVLVDKFHRLTDMSGKILSDIYYVYNYNSFSYLYTKSAYNRSPLFIYEGVACRKSIGVVKSLLGDVRRKKFNIKSFMTKRAEDLKSCIVKEFPVIIKGELKFLIEKDFSGNLTCRDMTITSKLKDKEKEEDRNNILPLIPNNKQLELYEENYWSYVD